MGIKRSLESRIKGFENIEYELEETGVGKKEIDSYKDLKKEYKLKLDDVMKLEKKEEKAEKAYLEEVDKIEKIEKKMKKLREKAGPLAGLKFSRVAFWSADGRLYRNLKARLKRAKAKKTLHERVLKELRAKAKGEERTLKEKRKSLNKCQKEIRKIWNQNKEEIKLVKNVKENRQLIKERFDETEQEEIITAIQELDQESELSLDIEAKDLNKKIDKMVKKAQKEKKARNTRKTRKARKEKIDFTDTELQDDDKELAEKDDEFKGDLKKEILFGKNSSIDRRKIEMMQKNLKSEILRKMGPEEYMAYVGFAEAKKRANEPVEYKNFVEETKDKNSETSKFYAKLALKSLEKMIKEVKSEDEIQKMDKADRFIYEMAKDYREIKDKAKKEDIENQIVI